MNYNKCEINETAEKIRTAACWDECWDEVQWLCDVAGMLDDLKAADGETFEGVIYNAAEKLGVRV